MFGFPVRNLQPGTGARSLSKLLTNLHDIPHFKMATSEQCGDFVLVSCVGSLLRVRESSKGKEILVLEMYYMTVIAVSNCDITADILRV